MKGNRQDGRNRPGPIQWALLGVLLPLAAVAQQPQNSVQGVVAVNAEWVQGVGPGYRPVAGAGLQVSLGPGTAFCGGAIQNYPGGMLSLAAGTSNYVYLNPAANCAPATNLTGFTSAVIPIAVVTTSVSGVTNVSDVRTLFTSGAAGAANNVVMNPSAGQTIQAAAAGVMGLAVKQPANGTSDVWEVLDPNGNKFWWVDSTGQANSSGALVINGLSVPSPVLTSQSSGGTLGAGTYAYRVTATNSLGETGPSAEQTITVSSGTANQVTVAWAQISGATGYRLYGRAAGLEQLIGSVTGGATVSFIDTGATTPSGSMPASDTTGSLKAAGSLQAASVVASGTVTASSFVSTGTGGGIIDLPTGVCSPSSANQVRLCAQSTNTLSASENGGPIYEVAKINKPLSGSLDLGSQAVVIEVPNATTGGTTLNALTKLTGNPSTALTATSSDTSGLVGITVGGPGTSGNAQIAIAGSATCAFDGATAAGDYLVASTTVSGDCHDAGASYPVGGQVIGRVLSTNTVAGTYNVALFGPEIKGGSVGSGSVTSVGLTLPPQFSVSGSPVTSSGTLSAGWANQNANQVLAGPASGGSAAPGFRSLTAADLPSAGSASQGAIQLAQDLGGSASAPKVVGLQGIAVNAVAPSSGQCLTYNSGFWGPGSCTVGTGGGTVASVGLSMPPEFSVSGSPVTGSGTLTVAKANENPNLLYAGPSAETSAAAAPTFRGVVPPDFSPPQRYVWLTDDFLGGLNGSTVGSLLWSVGVGSTNDGAVAANHPGILNLATGAVSGTVTRVAVGSSRGLYPPSGPFQDIHLSQWAMTWVVRVNDVTQHKVRFGLSDSYGNDPPPDGYFFEVVNTTAAGDWFAVTSAQGVRTAADTGMRCDNSFHTFKVQSDGVGNIRFYVDGTLKATNTTNLPTAGIWPFFHNVNTEAVSKSMDVDYFSLYLAVAR